MRESDLPEVAAIESAVFRSPWSLAALRSEALKPPSTASCLVAADADGVAGYAIAWHVLDETQLAKVAVADARRRAGIGRHLVAAIVSTARTRGQRRVTLEVRRSNVAAVALYRAFGFVEVGVRRGYYTEPSREDALLFDLLLGDG